MLKDEFKNEENTLQLCCVSFLLAIFDYVAYRREWQRADEERTLLQTERLRRHDQAKEFCVQRNMADPEADHMLDWLNLETINNDTRIETITSNMRTLETNIKQSLCTLLCLGSLYGEAKAYFDSLRYVKRMIHSSDYCTA